MVKILLGNIFHIIDIKLNLITLVSILEVRDTKAKVVVLLSALLKMLGNFTEFDILKNLKVLYKLFLMKK